MGSSVIRFVTLESINHTHENYFFCSDCVITYFYIYFQAEKFAELCYGGKSCRKIISLIF